MYLRTFEIRLGKYELDPADFSFCTRISMTNSFKKDKVKLDLLTDIDMLLMVEKGITG